MIKNYVKIAIRNIVRHKGYSFINIAGLAIGMACCILILLWVQDELSYDRFHENSEDLYRVIQDIKFTDYNTTWTITQGPLGPSLKKDFPEIINAAQITWRGFRLSYDEKNFDEEVGMADGSIFEMFTFPLLNGNPAQALSDPHSIVLTEEMAEKYFGNEDPIGKKIKANNEYDFVVTGVMKNTPRNSHLQFDFLIPFIFGRELNYSVDRWNNSQFRTYVQLQEGISAQESIQKISGYLFEKPTIEKDARLNLQPLTRVHLHSNYEFDQAHGDIKYVTIFSIIAIFILLIACINFMNLTTARSGKRAREVGMRKAVGAKRTDILRQFFGESILLAFIALVFALAIVWLSLPAFNNLSSKELSLDIAGNLLILLSLFCIAVLTGIIAGSYPAIFLSAFQPANVLKGSSPTGTKSLIFRKALVVFQFSLAILLIICTAFVYVQLSYMQNEKLGYDKEHMIYMGMRGEMRAKFETIKNELLQNPGITGVTASSEVPTYGVTFSNSLWRWDGQSEDEEILMRATFVDVDYFKTLGIEVVKGRSFSKEFPTDSKEAIMVNEKAAEIMRMESPLGKRLSIGDDHFKIIGVVKNYHFRSLHQEIDPLILIYNPEVCRVLFARLKSDNISNTISKIEKVWKKFAPGYPFRYRFLDEALDNLYNSEQRIGTIFRYFSFLAIFISCLGLFGMASFTAEQRTKEIGIRKILGASMSNIVLLLSKEFTKWVLVANIIAWPVAYYAMDRWLQRYAYRVNIAIWPFGLAAVLAFMIALMTVSYQAIRAAIASPADSLRYE